MLKIFIVIPENNNQIHQNSVIIQEYRYNTMLFKMLIDLKIHLFVTLKKLMMKFLLKIIFFSFYQFLLMLRLLIDTKILVKKLKNWQTKMSVLMKNFSIMEKKCCLLLRQKQNLPELMVIWVLRDLIN